MRRLLGAFSLIPVIAALALPAAAQTESAGTPPKPSRERNVSATGRVMPPATARAEAGSMPSSVAAEMQKAQKAAETRNKAWDSKMRKTMGSICSGC